MSNTDCGKLRTDIARLEEVCDSLRSRLDTMSKTMKGRTDFKESRVEAEKLENQLLEKYLDDFAEKNSELTSWKLEEKINRFEKENRGEPGVYAISPMPNGDMLVGGYNGTLYEYKKNDDGGWGIGDRITGFGDIYGDKPHIYAISPMPNGNMLVGGGYGALYEYKKNADGKWGLGNRITVVGDRYGDLDIQTISPMPNGNMLVGRDLGVLCEYKRNDDGSWGLAGETTGFRDKDGRSASVLAISPPMPNGDMLVGGRDGTLYEYKRNADGRWRLGDRITEFRDKNGHADIVLAISPPMPNGNMLVGGYLGTLCEYKKNADGRWELEKRITEFKDGNGDGVAAVRAISQMPNGNMLVGGDGGLCEYERGTEGEWRLRDRLIEFENRRRATVRTISPMLNGVVLVGDNFGDLYELRKLGLTVDALKENLGQIIKKGVDYE